MADLKTVGQDDIRALPSVGSTNAEVLALARAGENGPLWLRADRQTAGRGRRGRLWVSEPGNLYTSLLLTDPGPPERIAELCFVAAVALLEALDRHAPALGGRLQVKWPNDLLIDGAKLAGILIEGESGGGRAAVAIGIGVNLLHAPMGADYLATSLAAHGAFVDPALLLGSLAPAMAEALATWDRGRGFPAIREKWLMRAIGLGAPLVARLAQGEQRGIFQGLDAQGRLLLATEGGDMLAITSGEVFPLSPDHRKSSV